MNRGNVNTLYLRFFTGLLAAALAGANCFAEGGEPPDLLRWHRYAEPVFPQQLGAAPARGRSNLPVLP